MATRKKEAGHVARSCKRRSLSSSSDNCSVYLILYISYIYWLYSHIAAGKPTFVNTLF